VSPQSLVTIDIATGAPTLVGSIGATIADITFAADGTLYGWLEVYEPLVGTPAYDDLVTIDTTTAVMTVLGDSGLGTFGSGLAFAPDTSLYFAGEGDDGPLRIMDRFSGVTMSTVGTLSGGAGFTGDGISALAFDATGVLYGIENVDFGGSPAALVEIDSTTAAMSVRGTSIARMDALAVVCP
jgi:hypothetical protein